MHTSNVPRAGADFSKCSSLRHADLRQVDLSFAKLQRADLQGARLDGAPDVAEM